MTPKVTAEICCMIRKQRVPRKDTQQETTWRADRLRGHKCIIITVGSHTISYLCVCVQSKPVSLIHMCAHKHTDSFPLFIISVLEVTIMFTVSFQITNKCSQSSLLLPGTLV